MGVPKYTTPTVTLTFTEKTLDLTLAEAVYVTFRSGLQKLTKAGSDLEIAEKTIGVHLDQEDTARFAAGPVSIQANWIIAGERVASEIAEINISENLLAEVIA